MARATMSRGASDFMRMMLVHELDAFDGFQNAAFAAHRFGDEK